MVQVYLASLLDFFLPDLEAHYLNWLGKSEQARFRRYRTSGKRKQFLLGQVLLRAVLSKFSGINPPQLQFTLRENGKPRVHSPGSAACHFSLSHSGEYVVVAFARYPSIGIDIEKRTRQRRIDSIARRYFAPSENRFLKTLPPEQRLLRFYDLWTLKEAWLKAGGVEQAPSRSTLNKFGFDLESKTDQLGFWVDQSLAAQPGAWQFWLLELVPDHQIAVSVSTGGLPRVSSIHAQRLASLQQLSSIPLSAQPASAWSAWKPQ